MSYYAKISKSRSKKKPFKVNVYAKNGEPVMSPQLLTTRLNAKKNLVSTMNAFKGTDIDVMDVSGKTVKYFALHNDGYESSIDKFA